MSAITVTIRPSDDTRRFLDPRATYPSIHSAVLAGECFRWQHLELLLAVCPNLVQLSIGNFKPTSMPQHDPAFCPGMVRRSIEDSTPRSVPYDLNLPESAGVNLDSLTMALDPRESLAGLWKMPYVREIERIDIRLRRGTHLSRASVLQESVDFVLTALPGLAVADIRIVDGTLEVRARSQEATEAGRTDPDMLRRLQLYNTQHASPNAKANIHAVVAERAARALEANINDLDDQTDKPLATVHEGLRIPLSFIPAVARVADDGAVIFGGGLTMLAIEWDVPAHVVAEQLTDFIVPTQCAILDGVRIFATAGTVVVPAETLVTMLKMREWYRKLDFLALRGVVLSSNEELGKLSTYCTRIVLE